MTDTFNININSHSIKLSLQVSPTTTIRDVKGIIQAEKGISIDHIRFVFNGKTLIDDYTFADYNITADNTINMIIALIGG